MKHITITEDEFTELSILRDKATTALELAIEHAECARVQTLAYIASDYLLELNKTIQAMQTPKHSSSH